MKEHRLGWWREGDFEPKSEPPKGDNRLVKNAMENWEFDTEANIRLSVEDKQILAELDSLGFE